MDYVTLNNGVQMPMQRFGVFQVSDAFMCEQAVSDAIKVGYRLIDTASVYGNERAVGAAVQKVVFRGRIYSLQPKHGYQKWDTSKPCKLLKIRLSV